MAKTTIAQLEAIIAEQAAAIATLNARLDAASVAFKELRAEVRSAPKLVARTQPAGKPNPWFTAIKAIREERGLEPTAWVSKEEVLARMQQDATH